MLKKILEEEDSEPFAFTWKFLILTSNVKKTGKADALGCMDISRMILYMELLPRVCWSGIDTNQRYSLSYFIAFTLTKSKYMWSMVVALSSDSKF